MDDALVGGNVNAAVFLCRGQAEDVVVLVDRAADGAEAVMTVRQHIGTGKRVKPLALAVWMMPT